MYFFIRRVSLPRLTRTLYMPSMRCSEPGHRALVAITHPAGRVAELGSLGIEGGAAHDSRRRCGRACRTMLVARRNMRQLLLLAVLTITLMSGACVPMQNQRNRSETLSPADTLVACENETWSLIKRKDLKGFASYLAEDFYDIFPDGEERTKSELLEFLSGADLKDYRLSNFRVTMLNQDAGIVTVRSRCACVNSGKRDFDAHFRDIRLGQTWRQVVERVCCRYGATSTRFKVTAAPTIRCSERRHRATVAIDRP